MRKTQNNRREKTNMKKYILGTCILLLLIFTDAQAQKNELSIAYGGGILIGKNDSMGATVINISYARHITDHWGVDVSIIDGFLYDNPRPDRVFTFNKLGYGGSQIAVLYHLASTSAGKPLIPYLTAGIGFTSDDFTELPSYPVVRLGGGVKYFFGSEQRFGVKLELRNEIIGKNSNIFPTGERINLPSARVGVIWRF
jgi:hypothetical protein